MKKAAIVGLGGSKHRRTDREREREREREKGESDSSSPAWDRTRLVDSLCSGVCLVVILKDISG